MGKFEKHIGKGESIEIDGEEFVLKPLTTEFIPDFFRAMKAFSGASSGGITPAEILSNLDEEGLNAIKNMVEETLKKSFPDEWAKNSEEVKTFGLKYMHILIAKIFELNTATVQPAEKVITDKINTLQKS